MTPILPLLLGCTEEPVSLTTPTSEADVIDYTLDPADYPAPEGGEQWFGPEVVVQPYSEVQYCAFYTYTGPTMGMRSFQSWQAEGGHHLILLGTTAPTLDHPDGSMIDCTATADIPMTDFEPLINAEPISQGESAIDLGDSMAVLLETGQRYVVQAHYLNTSSEVRKYRDIMAVGLVPEDTVETWAAAFALTDVSLDLPPGQESSITFGCDFDTDYNILYLTGHMHEWGKTFALDKTTTEGTERIFTLDPWDPVYRDAPPLAKFAPGEMPIGSGVTLTTTCTWNNDTEEALQFPHEMCATYGMLYPSRAPVVCAP